MSGVNAALRAQRGENGRRLERLCAGRSAAFTPLHRGDELNARILCESLYKELVEEGLLEADGRDFRMQAWVVMPNHVHLVVDVWEVPLAKLVNGWKGKSSREANKLLGRRGRFWQEDYYDTLIRDEAHLKRAVRYTEQNPVKAFLAKAARDWPWSSAYHRDEYERLPWQRGERERGIYAA